MNLRDLRYVLAVAETRHFGRAAERCFVSQPTLSSQIKKLEEWLGITIFERTNRSVEVTPIGEAILVHARLLLEQADAIEQVARAHRDPLAGPLRVGAIPTLSPYLMPLILVPLRRQYPQLKLVLTEEITDALTQRLRKHELDAILIATPAEESDLQEMPLFEEPFWLAHPRKHPLYGKDDITRSDLESVDLLLLADGHCLARQVMDVCRLAERPHGGEIGDLRAASLETLLQLVGAGFGCTLVPALATRGAWMTDSGIIARRLHLADAYRRVSLVYRASFPRRQALEAFAGVILQHLPNTVRRLGPDGVGGRATAIPSAQGESRP
ncbi:MAG: LysR substrate-binding domain-containing protein [Gammaproteobacteria bacterium]|jgi:LysR family hydrogen peroxide-inducible transcriptional activator|nr:LysR substrate-binding domain-containing protein [Gammaproteobacteria bacterium]